MGSSGPSLGTLGLFGALFGDLWVTFGVPGAGFWIPLDGFGVPLGSLLEALGPFGGARGRLLAPFGLHLGPLRGEKCDKGDFWESLVFHSENHIFRVSGRPSGGQDGTKEGQNEATWAKRLQR